MAVTRRHPDTSPGPRPGLRLLSAQSPAKKLGPSLHPPVPSTPGLGRVRRQFARICKAGRDKSLCAVAFQDVNMDIWGLFLNCLSFENWPPCENESALNP